MVIPRHGCAGGRRVCIAFRLPEPVRGRQEKRSVLGEVFADDGPSSISIEAAFDRLKRIRTLKTVVLGFAALGFGLFTGPVLSNLFLQQHYHLGTFDRGAAATIQRGRSGLAALRGTPLRPALPAGSRGAASAGPRDPARCRPRSGGVLHAQLAALRRSRHSSRDPSRCRLRHDRPRRHVDRSLPTPGHRCGLCRHLHLLHRWHRWRVGFGLPHQRVRRRRGGDRVACTIHRPRGPVHHPRRIVHSD